ncbi:hypothetical protein BKA70DRAFT_1429195 [Coprinopsis sp. MPI-PUGE-AT-0042]|nr:hypothetical protein BKA70DRAFT_1429195 [Coprinopsis sp. MPI-PUGE-AT-0042]
MKQFRATSDKNVIDGFVKAYFSRKLPSQRQGGKHTEPRGYSVHWTMQVAPRAQETGAGVPSDGYEGITPSQGPLEGGIIGLPGVEIGDDPCLEDEWDDGMKVVVVHGTHTLGPYTVRAGAWDAYEPL